VVTPAAKLQAMAHLQAAFDVSERRAFEVLGVDPTIVHCANRQPEDTDVRKRIRSLAAEHRRFG
jgi:putative transposase